MNDILDKLKRSFDKDFSEWLAGSNNSDIRNLSNQPTSIKQITIEQIVNQSLSEILQVLVDNKEANSPPSGPDRTVFTLSTPALCIIPPVVPVAIISTFGLLKKSNLFITKATISAFLPSCAISAIFIFFLVRPVGFEPTTP